MDQTPEVGVSSLEWDWADLEGCRPRGRTGTVPGWKKHRTLKALKKVLRRK